jgi:allophanate hydrolase subunit 1
MGFGAVPSLGGKQMAASGQASPQDWQTTPPPVRQLS